MINYIYKITIPKRARCAQGLERYTNALSRLWPIARTAHGCIATLSVLCG
jgi:hypothetical protein